MSSPLRQGEAGGFVGRQLRFCDFHRRINFPLNLLSISTSLNLSALEAFYIDYTDTAVNITSRGGSGAQR